MKTNAMIAVLLTATLSMTGCASIVGQGVFPVAITSNPDGATILVRDEDAKSVFSGTTPTTVTLTAGESYFKAKSYNITFSKPGYADQYVELKATLSGWYFGNILFGGLIGALIVDPITGKMWKLPTEVTANLTDNTAANQKQQSLKIVTIDQIPQEMRKHLISIN